MGWEILVIPIIGVAVWIISTLARSAEEAKRGAPPRQKGEKVTDLDRFLREVQRRREAAERREDDEERTERRRQPPRRPPPVEEVAPVVEVVPVALPVTAAPMRVLEAPPLPVLPAQPVAPPPPPPRAEAAASSGLRELLRGRDGLRKAMILREVLGPPLARRGRPTRPC
jgi:hypothetical protein